MSRKLFLLTLGLAAVLGLGAAAFSTAASANTPENVQAAQKCLHGGYQDLYTQQGAAFGNPGDCVVYAIGGNELVQLKMWTIWPNPGDVDRYDLWGIGVDFSGLLHTEGYDMSYSLYLVPGDDPGGMGGAAGGSVTSMFGGNQCAAGYTGVYVTATTHEGYPVTSRTVPAGCPADWADY